MKRIILLSVLAIISGVSAISADRIIFRNGIIEGVKLVQLTDDVVRYYSPGKRNDLLQEAPSKDIYMIYIEKQGNVYFKKDGTRFTGEQSGADYDGYDIVYLVNGGEHAVKDGLRVTDDKVCYNVSYKTGGLRKKTIRSEQSFAKDNVFMIRYRNGLTEIITPIDVREEPVVEKVDEPEPEPEEPEFIVVFHTVKRGESLNKVASIYNVRPDQIREWNELPRSIKVTSPMTAGMQLMIYQPKAK